MTRRKKNGTEKCSVEGCTTPFYGLRYQQNYGGYLCNKHRIQFERHNKIYERTIYDKNKIFINEELNCAEMELYDRYGNVIATTLFDIENIPLVEKYKWYLSPRKKENYTDYVACGGSTSPERYLLHRLIMGDYDTYEDTDHKNGNGLDNRKSNLRQCNTSQNLLNRTKQVDSLLGFKNINYRKAGDKYVVQIVMMDEKVRIRKQYPSLQEAIDYRDAIYKRFLININLFRKEVDTIETFSYDYDDKNNKVFIHSRGTQSIIYGFLFDLIIRKKPKIYISDNYNPDSIDKFKKLLNSAELTYINWCILNDYIQSDPLSENNLDKTLNLVNEFRLSKPQKSIWLYTGYTISTCEYFNDTIFTFNPSYYHLNPLNNKSVKIDEKAFLIKQDKKRKEIFKNIDVLVDGKYIDSQRDITLPYRGSLNQRLIDVKQSLQKGKIVLWQI